jgi:NAD-dependent deacetylase
MLVAGSSLEVYPVADFPRVIKQHGGKLIIMNLEKTSYDDIADVVIHGDVAEVLPDVVSLLEGKA